MERSGRSEPMPTHALTIPTPGRGFVDVTAPVAEVVTDTGVDSGLAHVFLRHTSAGLILCENADPQVLRDLEAWMERAVPDGDPLFRHVAEGPDDMPAHVRSVLTGASLTLPVRNGRLALGTWQGIYLWEHRAHPHRRTLLVTVLGA